MTKIESLLTISMQYQADKRWESTMFIQYQILQTNIIGVIYSRVRRNTNEILGVKGLSVIKDFSWRRLKLLRIKYKQTSEANEISDGTSR